MVIRKPDEIDEGMLRLTKYRARKKYVLAFVVVMVCMSLVNSFAHWQESGSIGDGASILFFFSVYKLYSQHVEIMELRLNQKPNSTH